MELLIKEKRSFNITSHSGANRCFMVPHFNSSLPIFILQLNVSFLPTGQISNMIGNCSFPTV